MSHNQYITIIEQFGIVGFSAISICIILAIVRNRKRLTFTNITAILILSMAAFNEDVIENQAGLLFGCVFIFTNILASNSQYIVDGICTYSYKEIFRNNKTK